MNESNRRAARAEAFTLSMVDLFGCGFIAATFLFIFNMLQPQIDAAQRAGTLALTTTASAGGTGPPGPMLVSIWSNQPLDFVGLKLAASHRENGFFYDIVEPDSARVPWPYTLKLEHQKGAKGVTQVRLRATLNNEAAEAIIANWNGNGLIPVSFTLSAGLHSTVNGIFKHKVEVDLLPLRAGNDAYSTRFSFFSAQPIDAAVAWAGKVHTLETRGSEAGTLRIATANSDTDCTLVLDDVHNRHFTYCGDPTVAQMPDPAGELSQSAARSFAANECWKIDAADATCTTPTQQICSSFAPGPCRALKASLVIGGR